MFHTVSDDGIELNIEGFGNVISNWTDHAPTQNDSASMNIPASSRNVTLRWYEKGGGAVARLWWDQASPLASPSTLNASCSANGLTGILSWSPVSGATGYLARADMDPNSFAGTCGTPGVNASGDLCTGTLPASPTSYYFVTTPGKSYSVWVHTVKNGVVSNPPVSRTFSCPAGTLKLRATLNGVAWTGQLYADFTYPGGSAPNTLVTAPSDTPNVPTGNYSVTYRSGGPPGAILQSIIYSPTNKTLANGGTLTITLKFVYMSGSCSYSPNPCARGSSGITLYWNSNDSNLNITCGGVPYGPVGSGTGSIPGATCPQTSTTCEFTSATGKYGSFKCTLGVY